MSNVRLRQEVERLRRHNLVIHGTTEPVECGCVHRVTNPFAGAKHPCRCSRFEDHVGEVVPGAGATR